MDNLKVAFMTNRITTAIITKEIKEALDPYDLPIFKTRIFHRIIYKKIGNIFLYNKKLKYYNSNINCYKSKEFS